MLPSVSAEAKQQVVQDLARDPNTKVTASDAQQVLLNESLKAGAPAFTFDPNATPEQKAAQANAVSLRYSPVRAVADEIPAEQPVTYQPTERCRTGI